MSGSAGVGIQGHEPFPGQAQLGPTAEQGLSSAQRGAVCSEACPKYLGKNKKGGNQGSIQLAAGVLAHRSSRCSRRGVELSSQAMLGTWSPSPPSLTLLSPTAPRAPGTPSPTTDGTTSRTPGTAHAARPAAPPVPARRRAGLPRPPPSPPPPLPTAPGGSAQLRGPPRAAGICSARVGGDTRSRPPAPATGGAARPARWLHPPPSHLLSVPGGGVGCSGTRDLFLSACWHLVL